VLRPLGSAERRRRGCLPRGLVNLGNTCFLNAAVQALAHCTPLAAFVLQGRFTEDLNRANPRGTGCVLATVFAALLHELFTLRAPGGAGAAEGGVEDAHPQPFPPFDFLYAVAKFHPFLASGEMHDAQELLSWLLDALHEDLNRVHGPPGGGGGPAAADSARLEALGQERCAAEAWMEHLRGNQSVIVDLFQGQLRSRLRCPACGAVSVTFDPFLSLTLPLPHGAESAQLEDLVELFRREEVLDGDNAWECHGCRRRVSAHKKLDLWKLPPVLCVNVKRLEWVEEAPMRYAIRKLRCGVEFPVRGRGELDLGPLAAPEAPQKDPLLYSLVAVVDHHGDRADAGHYTATCRRPDGWWHFDDARTRRLPPGAPVVGPSSYVLVLERAGAPQEPPAISRQSTAAPEAWPHVVNLDWSFLSRACSHSAP